MKNLKEVFMRRDGLTEREAEEMIEQMRDEVLEILDESGSYEEVEDLLLDEYGVEMDYIMELF